jgi:hypothetical protein
VYSTPSLFSFLTFLPSHFFLFLPSWPFSYEGIEPDLKRGGGGLCARKQPSSKQKEKRKKEKEKKQTKTKPSFKEGIKSQIAQSFGSHKLVVIWLNLKPQTPNPKPTSLKA